MQHSMMQANPPEPTQSQDHVTDDVPTRAQNDARHVAVMSVPSVISVYSAEDGRMSKVQKITVYRY